MTIVDTHCHVSPYWYEPVEVLVHHMDACGVARATLVQYHGQFDNTYQAECVQRYPDRFCSVVELDSGSADTCARLEQLVGQGAAGLRLRPWDRSPGGDPLAIWRCADRLGIPVTVGSPQAEKLADEEFVQLIEGFPDLSIVVEHLGSANSPDGEETPYPVRTAVFALSRFPNVFLKFHGLGEFCERNMPMTNPNPFEGQVKPILAMALEAFGPRRMMWGSDWPPVSRREGYANALNLTRDYLRELCSDGELAEMFGGNALKVYRF